MSLACRILAVLNENPLVPVSTPDLISICACELTNARHRVWDRLRYLERCGRVRRYSRSVRSRNECGHGGNQKVTAWGVV